VSLESQRSLAHYRLVDKLGQGGMGVVWRATDTKLGRDVAIKVLPDPFLADPERLARFEREARVLASLTHANIAAIYGLERTGEHHFLVLELAEGETLADRLARGPIPVREALRIADQIAAALAAAHEKGIIHRDLKPANVKITPAGTVKVLDFGLAKVWEPQATEGMELTHSPTITAHMTSAGTILGTAGYMSPEQARGTDVDKRTDIWSFGCVLLEMLTGRQVFEGKTVTDVIASVVAREPSWERLPAETPRAVRRLLRRCLEKDADRRLRDIADVKLEIDEAFAAPESTESVERGAAPARGRLRLWQAIAATAILSAAALGFLLWRAGTLPPRVIRATIAAPPGTSFDLEMSNPGLVAVSPDGRRLAFSANDGNGATRLWLRDLDDVEARPVAGTDGAAYPFWSPDGRFVAFFAGDKLKKIEATGGPAITLCAATNGKGGTWNEKGVIIFAPSSSSPLFRVSAAGGEATPITEVDTERFNGHRFPQFLPDGDHFVFLARAGMAGETDSQVMVGSLSGGTIEELFPSASNAVYAGGHLFFVIEHTLMARRFDASRRELEGDMFPVAENVLAGPSAARGVFALSSDANVLVYHTGTLSGASTLQLLDREGKRLEQIGEQDAYTEARLSPDGETAVVSILDGDGSNQDLWLIDIARGLRDRFTFDPGTEWLAVWSPDGKRIVFASNRGGGPYQLYAKAIEGNADAQLLYADKVSKYPVGWSPDGRYVLYLVSDPKTSWDLYAIAVDQEGAEPVPLQVSPAAEGYGQVSPDGRWLLYTSDASGREEVYVTPFPSGGRKWQVSADGGTTPLWDPSGRAIDWLQGSRLMTAEVDGSGQAFRVGEVRSLIDGLRLTFAGPYQYDVASDGERFLVNVQNETTSPPMILVVGLRAELERSGD